MTGVLVQSTLWSGGHWCIVIHHSGQAMLRQLKLKLMSPNKTQRNILL